MKYATKSGEQAAVAAARWAARTESLCRVNEQLRQLMDEKERLEASLGEQQTILINAHHTGQTHYQTDYGMVRIDPHSNVKVAMVVCNDATDASLPIDWNVAGPSQPVDGNRHADPLKNPATGNVIGTDSGHGHAWKRPDGVLARCGGPTLCEECRSDNLWRISDPSNHAELMSQFNSIATPPVDASVDPSAMCGVYPAGHD